MKKQANKTASSGSSDKDSSAESSAPEEGEPCGPDLGVNSHSCQVELQSQNWGRRLGAGLHYSMASIFIAAVPNLHSAHGSFENLNEAREIHSSQGLVRRLKPIQQTCEESLH